MRSAGSACARPRNSGIRDSLGDVPGGGARERFACVCFDVVRCFLPLRSANEDLRCRFERTKRATERVFTRTAEAGQHLLALRVPPCVRSPNNTSLAVSTSITRAVGGCTAGVKQAPRHWQVAWLQLARYIADRAQSLLLQSGGVLATTLTNSHTHDLSSQCSLSERELRCGKEKVAKRRKQPDLLTADSAVHAPERCSIPSRSIAMAIAMATSMRWMYSDLPLEPRKVSNSRS